MDTGKRSGSAYDLIKGSRNLDRMKEDIILFIRILMGGSKQPGGIFRRADEFSISLNNGVEWRFSTLTSGCIAWVDIWCREHHIALRSESKLNRLEISSDAVQDIYESLNELFGRFLNECGGAKACYEKFFRAAEVNLD